VIAVVAQARMTSTRLPGKVLRPLHGGKRTLEYLVERIERCEEVDDFVLATSEDPSDDPVAELCERLGVRFHRGPLADVSRRYLEVLERFELDAFVRITGDSPLLDQRIVDRAVRLFRPDEHDLVTNVFPRTFPAGQSVELVSAAAFRQAYPLMSRDDEHEHVTRFFYLHPEDFRILSFTAEDDEGTLDVSLDTEEDARMIGAILARMDRPHWEYTHAEVTALYREEAAR
jgi:spore coat polysaccharide biosynthesis protein SpsF